MQVANAPEADLVVVRVGVRDFGARVVHRQRALAADRRRSPQLPLLAAVLGNTGILRIVRRPVGTGEACDPEVVGRRQVPLVAGVDARCVLVVLILVHFIGGAGDERAVGIVGGDGIDALVAGVLGQSGRHDVVGARVAVGRRRRLELEAAPVRRVVGDRVAYVAAFLAAGGQDVDAQRCGHRTVGEHDTGRAEQVVVETAEGTRLEFAKTALQADPGVTAAERRCVGQQAGFKLEIGRQSVAQVFRTLETEARRLPLITVDFVNRLDVVSIAIAVVTVTDVDDAVDGDVALGQGGARGDAGERQGD